MPLKRYKDDPPVAARVYTVCDESRYLIVRNVPALGCGDQLENLFGTYGDVEECKPMDAEDCGRFTDVYWIKFLQFETLSDTKEKLEGRRKEVLSRIKYGRAEGSKDLSLITTRLHTTNTSPFQNFNNRESMLPDQSSNIISHVSSDQEYFSSSSMNQTVQLVRDKLEKIKSSADNTQEGPASKRTRFDNRRRI